MVVVRASIRTATSRIAGCATGTITIRIAIGAVVDPQQGGIGDDAGGLESPAIVLDGDIARRTGDTFRLATMCVAGAVGKHPIGVRAVASGAITHRSTETLATQENRAIGLAFHGGAAEREDLARIDDDHTARQSVPGRRGDAAEGDGCVLGNPDDLIAALAERRRRCSLAVAIGQRGREIDDGIGTTRAGGANEFVQAGVADAGCSLAVAGSAAIVGAVAAVDDTILHLHDDQQIARGNGAGGAAGAHGTEAQRGRRCCQGRLVGTIEVAVDDSTRGGAGVVARQPADLLRVRERRQQHHCEQQY